MTDQQVDRIRCGIPASVALETSAGIAVRLEREAIWSGNRCNWIGAEAMERISTDRPGPQSGAGLTYRALGPDLYGGSSGVALFLSEISAVTGDDLAACSALGAMRHALSQTDDIEPLVRPGFYVGLSGIAHAALRVGSLLHVPEFFERGHALLTEIAHEAEREHLHSSGSSRNHVPDAATEFDVIAGNAGAVLALLDGHRYSGDSRLLAAGAMVADRLLHTARQSEIGWSWQAGGLRNSHDLTGLSHGAAGVAVALIEAFRATDDHVYADGARQAMRYENYWFNREEGNWPDFRPDVDGKAKTRRPTAFATLWCHGAPGIALSRWHAYRHLGEQQWLDDAVVAVHTAARATSASMRTGGANFSLCHGLLGNAECIREAGTAGNFRSSTNDQHSDAKVATRAGLEGIERHATSGLPWPCGTHTEETPNLMLGLAGIGYYYLRCAVPEIPSVLLPVAVN